MTFVKDKFLSLLLSTAISIGTVVAAQTQDTAKPPKPNAPCGQETRACTKQFKGKKCKDENGQRGVCATLSDNECKCQAIPKNKPAPKSKPSPAPSDK
ncbi:MAG TPA: hypothetical protein VGJ30_06500 [Candidatus Angelobacter sp.]|jgi:hypothetical protein